MKKDEKTNTEIDNEAKDQVQEQIAPEKEEKVSQVQSEENVVLTMEEFETLRKHIEALQKEKDEIVSLAQRLQADFDNYRKRNSAVRIDSLDEGMSDTVKQLLPVVDSLERATASAIQSGVCDSWIDGVVLVQKQLMETLKKLGLEEIPADGDFNPELHEAVAQESIEGVEAGKVTEVLQKGYRIKDRILRHSIVKVAN
jgi:molecular chaperone GrpE